MIQKSYSNKKNTLFLVGTPIGNLEEITFRAIETLKNVCVIFAEDTRVTGNLLSKYNISKPIAAYHKFNEEEATKQILKELSKGDVALVSDAGMPLISDPGYVVVNKVQQNDFNIVVISGANAAINALLMSGMDTTQFIFKGFLNHKASIKEQEIMSLDKFEQTIILYESKHRILETVDLLAKHYPERTTAVVKEISKIHETIIKDKAKNIKEQIDNTSGEFVIILEGNKKSGLSLDNDNLLKLVNDLVKNNIKPKDACKIISNHFEVKANFLYDLYIKQKE